MSLALVGIQRSMKCWSRSRYLQNLFKSVVKLLITAIQYPFVANPNTTFVFPTQIELISSQLRPRGSHGKLLFTDLLNAASLTLNTIFSSLIILSTLYPNIHWIYFNFGSWLRQDLEFLLLYAYPSSFFSHLLIKWIGKLFLVTFSNFRLNVFQSEWISWGSYYRPNQSFLSFT